MKLELRNGTTYSSNPINGNIRVSYPTESSKFSEKKDHLGNELTEQLAKEVIWLQAVINAVLSLEKNSIGRKLAISNYLEYFERQPMDKRERDSILKQIKVMQGS